MNQIIELKGEQAEQVPYPIDCPVYIYANSSDKKLKDPQTSQSEFIISTGTISHVFLQICSLSSAPELLYKVAYTRRCLNTIEETLVHNKLLRGDSLRLRNGCPIYVKYEGGALKGVVLGTCDIPLPESTQENVGDKFWYSVAVRDDGVDEGEAVSTIMHEVCQSSVSYRSQKDEVARENEIPQAEAEIIPNKRDNIFSENEFLSFVPTLACEAANSGTEIKDKSENFTKSHDEQVGKSVVTCGEKENSIESVFANANPVLDPKLTNKRPAEISCESDNTSCSSAKRLCNGIRTTGYGHSQDSQKHISSQQHSSIVGENEHLRHSKEHMQGPRSFDGSSSHAKNPYDNLDRYRPSLQKSPNANAAEISARSRDHLENLSTEHREFPVLAKESVLRYKYNSVVTFPVAQCDMAAILIGQGGTKLKELKNEIKCKVVVVGDNKSTEVCIFGNYAPNLEQGVEVIKLRVSEFMKRRYKSSWVEEEIYVDYCVGNKIVRSSRGKTHQWSQEDSFDSRTNQRYEHNRSSNQHSSQSPRFDQRRKDSNYVQNSSNSPDPRHFKCYHRLILPNIDSKTVNALAHAVIGPGGCNHKRFLKETGCINIRFANIGRDVFIVAAANYEHDAVNSLQYILETVRKELRLPFREASFRPEKSG